MTLFKVGLVYQKRAELWYARDLVSDQMLTKFILKGIFRYGISRI